MQAALLFRVRRSWNEQKTMQHTAAAGAAAPGGGGSGNRAFCPAPHRAGAGRRAGKADGCGGAAGRSRFLPKRRKKRLPKLPYANGVYVGSSRGYGGAVRVQVTMENGSITEVEVLDASHETKAVSAARQAAFDHRSGCPRAGRWMLFPKPPTPAGAFWARCRTP